MPASSRDQARHFQSLHQRGLLVLPNAWDAGTARVIESVGAAAIATTSAGVAWAHGYADGDRLPVNLLVATVAEITRAIRVPLSVDLEGGYSDDPGAVGDTVAAVIDAGAVGINLEDGNRDVDVLCAKIEHARRAAERAGVALYLNARIDAFIRPGVPAERRVEETIARAARYRAAGASGIFAIGVTDAADIRTLAAAVKLPLNVLARAGLPPASELEKLGVRRLSSGSGLAEIMHGRIATLAREFLQTGNSATVTGGAMPYRDLNSLMTPL